MLPYPIPDEYTFEDHVINGSYIYGVCAFENPDDWYEDLIGRAIPEMGDKYLKLFIKCKFHPFVFMRIAIAIDSPKSDISLDMFIKGDE